MNRKERQALFERATGGKPVPQRVRAAGAAPGRRGLKRRGEAISSQAMRSKLRHALPGRRALKDSIARIERYLPGMDAETRARAERTIRHLEGQLAAHHG